MNFDLEKRPKVWVGVIVKRDNKILLGKRKNTGAGYWCFPGGHLEYKEDLIECAKREVLEEVGIQIKNIKLGPYTNDNNNPGKLHYISIFVLADYSSGEIRVMEPNECEEWKWFTWNNLPEPLFLPV